VALTVADLDVADEDDFREAMGPLFEEAPSFIGRLTAARPFLDEVGLFDRARAIALAMPEEEQLELIDAHPRIGAAPPSVSAHSFREQGYETEVPAPVDPEAAELRATLDRLNKAYEARFGFRFVVFVAGRPRSEIVPVMRERLSRDRESERRTALVDIVAIAQDRWRRTATREEIP
jgi:OHCU decarboxylase